MRKPSKRNGEKRGRLVSFTTRVEPSTTKASKRQHPFFLDNLQGAVCLRCGYQWTPKITYDHDAQEWIQNYPKVCPRCKQKTWDKPADRRQWDKRFKRNFDDGG